MVWACDATGRDAQNKKHTKYDGDGNPTQRTSKNEMAWQTEKWHAHLWHQPRDGHWQKPLGCHGEKRWHHPDGRRRKRLAKVSIWYKNYYRCRKCMQLTCRLSSMMRIDFTWVCTLPANFSYTDASYSLISISRSLRAHIEQNVMRWLLVSSFLVVVKLFVLFVL